MLHTTFFFLVQSGYTVKGVKGIEIIINNCYIQ